MTKEVYIIISGLVGTFLGFILNFIKGYIDRIINKKDKEYEWFKEKVLNSIVDFVFEGLEVVDEAIFSNMEIEDSTKEKKNFNILDFNPDINKKYLNFAKKESKIRALIRTYNDEPMELKVEGFIEDLWNCINSIGADDLKYSVNLESAINCASGLIKYISELMTDGRKQASKKYLKQYETI